MSKDNFKVDIARIEQLIAGEMPVGLNEELFVLGCKMGISGEKLKELLYQVSKEYHTFSHEAKDYLFLGYMLGQDIFAEANERTQNVIVDPKNTTH